MELCGIAARISRWCDLFSRRYIDIDIIARGQWEIQLIFLCNFYKNTKKTLDFYRGICYDMSV